MSHIPNAAIPHASADEETPEAPAASETTSAKAAKLAEKARDTVRGHPKTAIAAGAAVVAGAVAAAAIPLVKGRRSPGKSAGAKSAKKG